MLAWLGPSSDASREAAGPLGRPVEPGASHLDAAREGASAEIAGFLAILDACAFAAPSCGALVRAWHALASLDAVLRGAPVPDASPFEASLRAHGRLALPPSLAETKDDFVRAVLARATEHPCTRSAQPTDRDLRRHRRLLLRTLAGLDREARRRITLPWRRYLRVFFAALVVVLGLVLVFEILYWPRWRASYYANIDLSGGPALVTQVPEATQNWGFSSPGAALPADNFSARFETCLRLAFPAHVSLTVGSDDGSRVFIDELPVLDAWHDQGFTQRQLSADLEKGVHKIRLEYYERAGGARLMFSGRIGDKDLTHSLRLPAANGTCPR